MTAKVPGRLVDALIEHFGVERRNVRHIEIPTTLGGLVIVEEIVRDERGHMTRDGDDILTNTHRAVIDWPSEDTAP